MTCHVVDTGNGRAIVCTRERGRRCASCGALATLLCDWKVPHRRSGTCDQPICPRCTVSPAPEKDLCPEHAAAWQARLAARLQPKGHPA